MGKVDEIDKGFMLLEHSKQKMDMSAFKQSDQNNLERASLIVRLVNDFEQTVQQYMRDNTDA